MKKEPNRFRSTYGGARAAELAGDKREGDDLLPAASRACEGSGHGAARDCGSQEVRRSGLMPPPLASHQF